MMIGGGSNKIALPFRFNVFGLPSLKEVTMIHVTTKDQGLHRCKPIVLAVYERVSTRWAERHLALRHCQFTEHAELAPPLC